MGAVVQIDSGRVEGTTDRGVHAFLGVPYAAPPVGAAGFESPAPPMRWDGVRDGSRFGPVVLQQKMPGMFGELGTPPNPAGDDCLNLNVWTPDPAAAGCRCWCGSTGARSTLAAASTTSYNGAAFARDGVVAVTINYRLGVQGFWHLGGAVPRAAESGNLGMLDQTGRPGVGAGEHRRVRRRPGQVTIAGESAGGMSVATLLAMPRARGLFHRAITPERRRATTGSARPRRR